MDISALNTLCFHMQQLAGAEVSDTEHHWSKALAVTAQVLAQPAPAGQAALRKHLLEFHAAAETRRLSANFTQLLRLLQQASAKAAGQPTKPAAAQSPIEEVAGLLRGRALLVIGGLSRPEHAASLRDAFDLCEVIWPNTKESNARVSSLEPHIARADVAVVLLLIRWIRHAFNDAAAMCERHGKPMVRVPGGYNPDQVAPLILEQCGRRLRG